MPRNRALRSAALDVCVHSVHPVTLGFRVQHLSRASASSSAGRRSSLDSSSPWLQRQHGLAWLRDLESTVESEPAAARPPSTFLRTPSSVGSPSSPVGGPGEGPQVVESRRRMSLGPGVTFSSPLSRRRTSQGRAFNSARGTESPRRSFGAPEPDLSSPLRPIRKSFSRLTGVSGAFSKKPPALVVAESAEGPGAARARAQEREEELGERVGQQHGHLEVKQCGE